MNIEIQAREMASLCGRMEELLAWHTGQPVGRISVDTDRDDILGARDAVAYGFVDHVVDAAAGAPLALGSKGVGVEQDTSATFVTTTPGVTSP